MDAPASSFVDTDVLVDAPPVKSIEPVVSDTPAVDAVVDPVVVDTGNTPVVEAAIVDTPAAPEARPETVQTEISNPASNADVFAPVNPSELKTS